MEVLAELGPRLADLPVIVITALGGSAAAIEAMRRGAYDYLTKPFDSATHRDLARELAAGRFREDLYYRLNVARILIPPLRDRPEDIAPLAEHILRRVELRHGWGLLSLSPEALRAIQERTWPGNVRQLENTLARAVIVARGRTILPEHLDVDRANDTSLPASADSSEPIPLRALLADVERRAIQRALVACQGNRTRTAERLGISRRQLFDKIRECDLHP